MKGATSTEWASTARRGFYAATPSGSAPRATSNCSDSACAVCRPGSGRTGRLPRAPVRTGPTASNGVEVPAATPTDRRDRDLLLSAYIYPKSRRWFTATVSRDDRARRYRSRLLLIGLARSLSARFPIQRRHPRLPVRQRPLPLDRTGAGRSLRSSRRTFLRRRHQPRRQPALDCQRRADRQPSSCRSPLGDAGNAGADPQGWCRSPCGIDYPRAGRCCAADDRGQAIPGDHAHLGQDTQRDFARASGNAGHHRWGRNCADTAGRGDVYHRTRISSRTPSYRGDMGWEKAACDRGGA